MGSPEAPPPDDDEISRIIRLLINATLTGGTTGEDVHEASISEQDTEHDPLHEGRRQAQIAWEDTARLLESGQKLSHESSAMIGLLLYTLIGDAIERRATQEVESYVSALDGLAIRRDIKSASYVRAMQAGYVTAGARLHSALLAEWDSTPLETAGSPDPATTSPLLRSVVQVCQQNSSNPDTFINNYALSPAHALLLRLLRLKQPATHENRPALEAQIVNEFTNLSTTNTLAIAKQALDTVIDPHLRLRIIQRTLAVIEDSGQAQSPDVQHLVEKTFGELIWCNMSGEETIQHMAHIIETNHGRSSTPFVDAWEVDQRIFAGNTSAQIVEFIDDRTTPALSNNGFGFEADIALTNRDILLQKYAALYAAYGDFKGATLLLAAIGNASIYEAALHSCIEHSSSVEELQALRPSNIYDELDGSTIPSFAMAMADYTGDTEGLCVIAMDLARDAATDVSGQEPQERLAAPIAQLSSFLTDSKRNFYLYTAFKRIELQDPLRSYRLATDILEMLRTHDNPHTAGVVQFLSDALVRDGDESELRRAFDALPQDDQGNRQLRGVIRLLNLRSSSPIPEWLRTELDFACD